MSSCFVVGYTGECGKELVKYLSKSEAFSKLWLLGRRTVNLSDCVRKDKVEQVAVDFENLEAVKSILKECKAAFCCLGTTYRKSGKEGFIKVDKTFTLAAAQLARDIGVSEFHHVSSTGANAKSWFLYPRVKGEVEDALKGYGFEKLAIYRPKFLSCDREESRPMERAGLFVTAPLAWMAPSWIITPTDLLARAIVATAEDSAFAGVKLLCNPEIYSASNSYKSVVV